MKSSSISPITRIFATLLMLVLTVMAIYPIFWVIIQSFKTHQSYLTTSKLKLPAEWFFKNYPIIWNQFGFPNFFKNSVIYTLSTVVLVLLFSLMAGFAFGKINFKITKIFHAMFVIGILLTIQSILIPLFIMMYNFGLYNTRLGVLIPYVGLGLPMGVYLCTDFIKNAIPNELIESAKIDGASYMRIFLGIIIPMCAPVAATLAIISFTGTWNEFVLMDILTSSDDLKAIPAMVARFTGSLGSNYGRVFTTLSLSLIPMLLFYLIFSNQITKGVAAGAVKG